MVRISGEVAADRAAASARARAALASEAKARAALEAAQARSGAALALARMAGVPWRELQGDLGMSRQALVERLARWGRGAEGGEGTKYVVPSMARAGGEVPVVDDGLGEPPALWSQPQVQASVESAVRWVQSRTRAAAGRGVGDVELVEQCQAAARAAVAACLAKAREQAQTPGTNEVLAARAIYQAGAATAPVVGGQS